MYPTVQERDRLLFNELMAGASVGELSQRFFLPVNRIGFIIRTVAEQRNPKLYASASASGEMSIAFIRQRAHQFSEIVAEELQHEQDRADRLKDLGPDLHTALTDLMKAASPELASSPAGMQAMRVLMKASGLVPVDA